jgi:Tfp pilus assembly protein PilN
MASQNPAEYATKPDTESANPDELEALLGRSALPKRSRPNLILWLTSISMFVFFIPLYLFSVSVSEDTKAMNTDLGFMKTSLTQVATPAPAIQELLTPLAQSQGQLSQLNAVLPTIAASRPDWPAIMTAIGNYDPNYLTLTSMTRTLTSLTISGRAYDGNAITTFAHGLEQSNLFSRVTIQSIRAITVTPTVTLTKSSSSTGTNTATPLPSPYMTKTPIPQSYQPPTAAPFAPSQPTSIPPTATPDLRDLYEPDASQPHPIAIGQPQVHNFYPDDDVDAVSFLAKGGRYYHVYTSNLAPGVDTIVNVRIGGIVLENDDVVPGSLYSDIVIQNTGSDTTAIVTILDRGMYGADKTYQIAVEEVSATPTPPPTAMPSPTPTQTSVPTATSTATPTATPNLRDAYEPDDVNPVGIYLGATQSHTFSPSGDIDKVSFLVKAGRYYQALTSSLALGVDTVVTVTVDNLQWTNDDYTSGNNNFASSVCFPVVNDGQAVATIANKDLQYGADKTYKISVSEIPTLTVSSCVRITPVPVASYRGKTVPGYAMPIRSDLARFDPAVSQSISAPTLEFIIIADLKVTSP